MKNRLLESTILLLFINIGGSVNAQSSRIEVETIKEFEVLFCAYLDTFDVVIRESDNKPATSLFFSFDSSGNIQNIHFLSTNYTPKNLVSIFKVCYTLENSLRVVNSLGLSQMDLNLIGNQDLRIAILIVKCGS